MQLDPVAYSKGGGGSKWGRSLQALALETATHFL